MSATNATNMEEIEIKSALPYYAFGLGWFAVSFVVPMYRLDSLAFGFVAGIFASYFGHKYARVKVIQVPAKVVPTGEDVADKFLKTARESLAKLQGVTTQGAITGHVDAITNNLQKIIDFIQKYPKKARKLSTFADYYLPTTIRLIENYAHLSRQNQTSENITASKQNIEAVMPTMVTAFENQLDALFYDKALDIKAEVALLNDLLQRQGLV